MSTVLQLKHLDLSWLGGGIREEYGKGHGGMTEDSVPENKNHLCEGPPYWLVNQFSFLLS